jgi:membrane protein implicated in regulation of membrane protease activity
MIYFLLTPTFFLFFFLQFYRRPHFYLFFSWVGALFFSSALIGLSVSPGLAGAEVQWGKLFLLSVLSVYLWVLFYSNLEKFREGNK